jgi:hypothetical protein
LNSKLTQSKSTGLGFSGRAPQPAQNKRITFDDDDDDAEKVVVKPKPAEQEPVKVENDSKLKFKKMSFVKSST